ncbi:hypothetical protein [Magnetospirillum sp. 64-120]|uniref:hypothetical protein n=1 Tax=Magnetospirillum sp. 64-120 TaxID=1895778 RepID=UPI00092B636C|nr:hypothetical protein [Magnetospirillum sp. 64-120]OJX81894.1 MAG: hypothetical protein BGO92_16375 [Magnetospirillum sp. 64-120]
MNTNACTPADHSSDCRAKVGTRFPLGAKIKAGPQYLGNDEPSLDDLLGDDVLKRLMARDGVAADQVRQLAGFIPN